MNGLTLPGKILSVNGGDTNGNGVPDYADGILIFDDEDDSEIWGRGGSGCSPKFVPVVFEVRNAENVGSFSFSYSACDPKKLRAEEIDEETANELDIEAGTIFHLQDPASEDPVGALRLWTRDGGVERSSDGINKVRNDLRGNFIEPGVNYTFADLEIEEASGTVTLTFFLEAVRLSQAVADLPITVTLFDDEGEVMDADTVNTTVLQFGIRNDDFEVSADDVFCPLTAFTNLPGLSTSWTLVLGTGLGYANPLATADAQGNVENEFQMSGVAGVQYRVKVKIVGFAEGEDWFNGPEYLTGVITVVPGLCNNVDIAKSVTSLPADGQSTMELTATFQDQFNNLIEPGTPILWLLAGLGNLSVSSNYTNNSGQVSAVLTAGDIAGFQSLWIEADGHGFDIQIDNTPVAISLTPATGSPTSLDVTKNDTIDLTASFTSVKNGTPVRWFTTNGQLLNASSVVQNNSASAQLKSTGAHVRDALVTVGLGNVMRGLTVPFTAPATPPANLTPALTVGVPILAGDASSGQPSVNVEQIDGTPQAVTVETGTSVTLHAPAFKSTANNNVVAQLVVSHPSLVDITDASGNVMVGVVLDTSGNGTFRLRSKGQFTPSASQRAVSISLQIHFAGDDSNPPGYTFTLPALQLAGKTALAIQAAALEPIKVSDPNPRPFSTPEKNGAQFQLLSVLASTNQLFPAISVLPAGDMVDRANYAYRSGLWMDQTPTATSAVNRVLRAASVLPGTTPSEKQGFLEQVSRALYQESVTGQIAQTIASLDTIVADQAFGGIVRLCEDHFSWPTVIFGTTATSPDDLRNLGRLSHGGIFGSGREDQSVVRRVLFQLRRFSQVHLRDLAVPLVNSSLDAVENFLRGLVAEMEATVPAAIYPSVASNLGFQWGFNRELIETLMALEDAAAQPITLTKLAETFTFIVALSQGENEAWNHLERAIPIYGAYLTGQAAWDKYKVGQYFDGGVLTGRATVKLMGDVVIISALALGAARLGTSAASALRRKPPLRRIVPPPLPPAPVPAPASPVGPPPKLPPEVQPPRPAGPPAPPAPRLALMDPEAAARIRVENRIATECEAGKHHMRDHTPDVSNDRLSERALPATSTNPRRGLTPGTNRFRPSNSSRFKTWRGMEKAWDAADKKFLETGNNRATTSQVEPGLGEGFKKDTLEYFESDRASYGRRNGKMETLFPVPAN